MHTRIQIRNQSEQMLNDPALLCPLFVPPVESDGAELDRWLKSLKGNNENPKIKRRTEVTIIKQYADYYLR